MSDDMVLAVAWVSVAVGVYFGWRLRGAWVRFNGGSIK